MRTLQADLAGHEPYPGRHLLGTPWGALYLWQYHERRGPHHRFSRYDPEKPLPRGERVSADGPDAIPSGPASGPPFPVLFSKTVPRAYVVHTDAYTHVIDPEDYTGSQAELWDLDRNEKLDVWRGDTDYFQDLLVSEDERTVAVHYFWTGSPACEVVFAVEGGDLSDPQFHDRRIGRGRT